MISYIISSIWRWHPHLQCRFALVICGMAEEMRMANISRMA